MKQLQTNGLPSKLTDNKRELNLKTRRLTVDRLLLLRSRCSSIRNFFRQARFSVPEIVLLDRFNWVRFFVVVKRFSFRWVRLQLLRSRISRLNNWVGRRGPSSGTSKEFPLSLSSMMSVVRRSPNTLGSMGVFRSQLFNSRLSNRVRLANNPSSNVCNLFPDKMSFFRKVM